MDICLQLSKRLEKVDKKINTYICLKYMVFEELCLNIYHHIITEGYTMGNSSLVQQVLSNYMSRYGGTFCYYVMVHI